MDMSTTEKKSTGPNATEMHYAILPERMAPLRPEQWNDDQRKLAEEVTSGPRGELLGPFPTMLRSPNFLRPFYKWGEYSRFHSPVDQRILEIAALMTARSWSQQFEWDVHIRHAKTAGVNPAISAAIAEGRRPTEMAQDEEVLYDFVKELQVNQSVCDTTYARALEQFGERGIIDILGGVGYYTALAMMMNVCRTSLAVGKRFEEGRPLPLLPLPARFEHLKP
jgi:4-carboxymuconolactone decarboxylase